MIVRRSLALQDGFTRPRAGTGHARAKEVERMTGR
jgi:hypothetical protein